MKNQRNRVHKNSAPLIFYIRIFDIIRTGNI